MNDPARLDPIEQYVDDLLRFENRDRYSAQSRATEVNALAPLPPRAPMLPINPFTTRSTTR